LADYQKLLHTKKGIIGEEKIPGSGYFGRKVGKGRGREVFLKGYDGTEKSNPSWRGTQIPVYRIRK
jgi:hypothetical protein